MTTVSSKVLAGKEEREGAGEKGRKGGKEKRKEGTVTIILILISINSTVFPII